MPGLAEKVAEAKAQVEAERDDLLRTFSFVPDGKLTWSPSETARSSMWIVAHCGLAGRAFATFLRGEQPPFPSDPAEAGQMIWNAGRDVTSRQEAIRLVEESTDETLLALDSVTEDRMGSMTQTPFGPMPYSMWVMAATTHMGGHARQIDYIQTIWGDIQDHR